MTYRFIATCDEQILGMIIVEHRPRTLRESEADSGTKAVKATMAVIRQVGPWKGDYIVGRSIDSFSLVKLSLM